MGDAVENAHKAAERVARESYGRLLAFLAVRTRDVAGAEDALADAFAAALRTWPDDGVPDNPDAWLLTAARHRQTDVARRRQTREAGEEHLRLMAEEIEQASQTSDEIPDRRLALMFACAHPAIEAGMRAPLILADHPRADAQRLSPRPFSFRPRPWASAWCAPRRASGRPASPSGAGP